MEGKDKMNNKEIENVIKLDKTKKYEYFIKKIVDYEEVWSLRDEEGQAMLGEEDNSYFPVWAKKEYSDLCISEEWKGYYSESITLEKFMDVWIPNLKCEGSRITIMWNNGSGIDVDWDILLNDIRLEMEKY